MKMKNFWPEGGARDARPSLAPLRSATVLHIIPVYERKKNIYFDVLCCQSDDIEHPGVAK